MHMTLCTCMPAVCGYGRAAATGMRAHAGAGSPEQPSVLVPPPRRGAAIANRGQGCCVDWEYYTTMQAGCCGIEI